MQKGSSSSVRIFYPECNRAEVIKILSERLKELNERLPVVRVVLFGSYAEGNYTVASDIDLLIVYAGKERADAYALVKKTLGLLRLEPHLYTEAEYQQARDRLTKMAEGGVELFPKVRVTMNNRPRVALLYYPSAFFSQQATEKVLTGFLYSRGYRALITHSVVELLEESAKFNEGFRGLLDSGKELERHYIGSRTSTPQGLLTSPTPRRWPKGA